MDTLTPEYRDLLIKMHADKPDWGLRNGATYHQFILPHLRPTSRVLDWGCGKGSLGVALKKHLPMLSVTNYDPGMPEWSKEPKGTFDLVVCLDVLEHVETEEYADAVITKLRQHAKRDLYICVFLAKAKAILPDGRNSHLLLRPADWWLDRLASHGIERTDRFVMKDYKFHGLFRVKDR